MSEVYVDYLDYYRRGPYASYLNEHRLTGSSRVRLLDVSKPAGIFPDPPLSDFIIVLCKTRWKAAVDLGSGCWRGWQSPGDLWAWGPGTSADITVESAHRFRVVAIPPATFQPWLDEAGRNSAADFERLRAAPFRDPCVESLCQRLWDEASSGSSWGSLFADSAVQTLVLTVLRRAELMSTEPEPDRGTPLAHWRLRRCFDFLNENLGEDIGLAELADAAGLSHLYFAKAFKRATGMAPHRYLVWQRVERAKELLADTDLTVAEVAATCGLYDQSHLASWFKRLVGTTPAKFRAAQKR